MIFSITQTILVTGANGQLGNELRKLANNYPGYTFLFSSHQELAIEDSLTLAKFFGKQKIDFCINCAAYTAVDKAETEKEAAYLINGTAVGELAAICKTHGTRLIHISTDYVYDGAKRTPLKETDPVSPMSVYGKSKLKGEELAMAFNPESIVIRTSWVYSYFGNNFLKTMITLMTQKLELRIVSDQVGCPTYAADLARTIMLFISRITSGNLFSGIYNYANEGITSWYQYALLIKETIGSDCNLIPVTTSQYSTAAIRPLYSVLDTTKIKNQLNPAMPFWKDSVQVCIQKILNGRLSEQGTL